MESHKMKTQYEIEITDTFGGESNYSWVKRYTVQATTPRGAMRIAARDFGGEWRKEYETSGGMARYNIKGACICAFVTYSEN
jgi:hypothetical protein